MDNRYNPTYDNIRRIWSVLGYLQKKNSTSQTDIQDLQDQIDAIPAPHPIMPNQENSVAVDVAGLVTDLNALLTKLKNAGLMEQDL